MRLKSSIVWILVLAAAFALGYMVMRWAITRDNAAVQGQNAPGAPQ